MVLTQSMDKDLTRRLAQCAALPLSESRQQAAAQVLAAWLPDANALSEKMRAARYQTLLPATVFLHPELVTDEA